MKTLLKCNMLLFFLVFSTLLSGQNTYTGMSNIQLLYGEDIASRDISLTTLTVEHVGSYGMFEQFGFADFFYNHTADNFDIYIEYYPKIIVFEEKLKLKPLSKILMGGGINTLVKNTDDFFVILGGPVWQFDVPGFNLFQLETYLYHHIDFDTSFQLTYSWDVPVQISEKVKLRVRGFIDYIGPYTSYEPQVVTQPQLLFDTGNLWNDPGKLFIGMEWRYWHNFAGQEGVTESLPQLEILFGF